MKSVRRSEESLTSRINGMGNATMSGRGHGRIKSKQLAGLDDLPPESLNRAQRRAKAAEKKRRKE